MENEQTLEQIQETINGIKETLVSSITDLDDFEHEIKITNISEAEKALHLSRISHVRAAIMKALDSDMQDTMELVRILCSVSEATLFAYDENNWLAEQE